MSVTRAADRGPSQQSKAQQRDQADNGQADAPFRGKSVLVTGGSRGLGLLIAGQFADQGARLVICARDEYELRRAAERLRCRGAEVHTLVCDLADPGTPEKLVELARKYYGGIDVLVNNAGVIEVGPVESMTEQDFRTAMEIMFFAPLRLVLAVLPQMRERRSGTIVDVTSVGGRIAAPHLVPYAAAKFAATGLSEGLRAELADDGVSVTTVVPGLMRTGSHGAARYSGKADQEYAWFAAAASLPLVSMDAERAARTIVRAAGRGRPEVVLSFAAKAAVRAHGLAPATTVRLLTLADRLLPDADGETARDIPGVEAARRLGGRAMSLITTLGDRAARRNNEPVQPSARRWP
ncbi:MAG TPA: SDR family NAD(P)-dependent oxidoreductase [Actinocrinis sp.]|nr:SDR family NAD(P)-dependent oxidoreductase [Actinocrinis sp.]